MVLIFYDIDAFLAYYIERMASTRTDEPGKPDVTITLIDHFTKSCDEIIAAVKELDSSLRALVLDRPPQYGFHLPGIVALRIVDNADRSGANCFKRVNATYSPASSTFKSGPLPYNQ